MADLDEGVAAQQIGHILNALLGNQSTDLIENVAATSTQPAPPAPPPTSASYSGGGEVGSRDQDNFYTALLQRLGMPVSDENLRFMRAWNQGEGMDAGHFNPFATTQDFAGSRSLNSVGVKAYSSLQDGVEATAQTLLNGRYQGILDGLANSNAVQAAQGVANSPWGTGDLVLRVLGAA